MESLREELTDSQIKGITHSVKMVNKKFPYIKGWKFDEDYEKYQTMISIQLIVDVEEISKVYNKPLRPDLDTFRRLFGPYSMPSPLWILSDYRDNEELKDKSYNIKKEITFQINEIYRFLMDDEHPKWWFIDKPDKKNDSEIYISQFTEK